MAEAEVIVLDASVIVKWFSDEDLTDEALELRQRYLDDELAIVVPDLVLHEVANALRYNPSFNSSDVKKAVQSLFDMDFEIVAPSQEVVGKATDLSFELGTTLYDSTYLALAEDLDCDLITTDQEIVDKSDKAFSLENI